MSWLGSFHPLAVHFPVALLLLVPPLEWGRRRGSGLVWHRRAYLAVLLLTVLLVAATGYLGAELTHGAGHIVR